MTKIVEIETVEQLEDLPNGAVYVPDEHPYYPEVKQQGNWWSPAGISKPELPGRVVYLPPKAHQVPRRHSRNPQHIMEDFKTATQVALDVLGLNTPEYQLTRQELINLVSEPSGGDTIWPKVYARLGTKIFGVATMFSIVAETALWDSASCSTSKTDLKAMGMSKNNRKWLNALFEMPHVTPPLPLPVTQYRALMIAIAKYGSETVMYFSENEAQKTY